jgi:hypothetical protein
MNGDPKIDIQLKLYQLLVNQLQKHATILWQLPTALLAANAFALDKCHEHPWLVLAVAVFNGVLAHAYRRVVIQLYAITKATKAAEALFSESGYGVFIPEFSKGKVGGGLLISIMLWTIAVGLGLFSVIKISGL